MNSDAELASIATARHGVFSLEHARQVGIPDRTVRDRANLGRYLRLYPGVYSFAGSVPTVRQQMVAAVDSFPELAAISHQTAAELWGLTSRGFRTIEVVTRRWDREHRSRMRVHESLDLIAADVVNLDGIPTTSVERTVVDLGASNKWLVEYALEQGIRLGLVTLADVEGFMNRVARRGRRGVGVIRPLLKARRKWDSATESALEDRFRKLLDEWGLPVPVLQYNLHDHQGRFVCRADFAYPAARLLIELDSEAHHLDRIAFRRDRGKQNRAVVLGWTVLRYTWWDLEKEAGRVVSEIRSKVAGPPVSA
ncbi:MAG: DUF559 domain-containing protein [bacterium]|nr:DUF559 domain-containing protein [bacterium]